MTEGPELKDGKYPFVADWLPLSDLAWIEVPASIETLLRNQAQANGIELIKGRAVELRCVTPEYGDAVFMVFLPHEQDRLHMLAPKEFQKGKA